MAVSFFHRILYDTPKKSRGKNLIIVTLKVKIVKLLRRNRPGSNGARYTVLYRGMKKLITVSENMRTLSY